MIRHFGAVLLLIGFISITSLAHVDASTPRLPNLQALPASDLRIADTPDGLRWLRFSATTKNVGAGPLELFAGAVSGNTQKVHQRVYVDGGEPEVSVAGDFVYHAAHQHFHFEDYAIYVLQPVDAPGASQRTGSKVTFCIMDTTKIDTRLPGAPKQPKYTTCNAQTQGMSVGWGDTYSYYLAGQEIEITGLPNGTYDLTIQVDPKARIRESVDTDNMSVVRIRMENGTVCVLGNRRCR